MSLIKELDDLAAEDWRRNVAGAVGLIFLALGAGIAWMATGEYGASREIRAAAAIGAGVVGLALGGWIGYRFSGFLTFCLVLAIGLFIWMKVVEAG